MIHVVVLTATDIVTALTRFAAEKQGLLTVKPMGVEITEFKGRHQATVTFEPVPTVIGGVKEAT